ncbi:hypothetical protein ACU4GI_47130 (plasmid) [Cupriavidus basilensis]
MEPLAVLIVAALVLLAFAKRGHSDHAPKIDPFFFSQDKDSMDDDE